MTEKKSEAGADALETAVSDEQAGVPSAMREASAAVRAAFRSGALAPWLGNETAEARQLNCARFSPHLVAIIVSQLAAKKLLEDRASQEAMVRTVALAAATREQEARAREFACIVYADTPPEGSSPNTPAALLTTMMDQDREALLWNSIQRLTGVSGYLARPEGPVRMFLVHAKFPLHYAVPDVPDPSIWDRIAEKYGVKSNKSQTFK